MSDGWLVAVVLGFAMRLLTLGRGMRKKREVRPIMIRRGVEPSEMCRGSRRG